MNNLYEANFKYTENRGEQSPQKQNFSFKKAKNNTLRSLTEVSYFFNNFNNFIKYIKLYKLLK